MSRAYSILFLRNLVLAHKPPWPLWALALQQYRSMLSCREAKVTQARAKHDLLAKELKEQWAIQTFLTYPAGQLATTLHSHINCEWCHNKSTSLLYTRTRMCRGIVQAYSVTEQGKQLLKFQTKSKNLNEENSKTIQSNWLKAKCEGTDSQRNPVALTLTSVFFLLTYCFLTHPHWVPECQTHNFLKLMGWEQERGK